MLYFRAWFRRNLIAQADVGQQWAVTRIGRQSLLTVLKYALFVFTPYFRPSSVFGFSLLVGIGLQMASGFLLALYYVPDPSFVLTFREEYFNEVW
jgi:hypothetical protein